MAKDPENDTIENIIKFVDRKDRDTEIETQRY